MKDIYLLISGAKILLFSRACKYADKLPKVLKFLNFFVLLQRKYQNNTKNTLKQAKSTMKRNFLPQYVGISMTKGQFCFCTGLTPYKLRQLLLSDPKKWERLGYNKFDKLLMPAVISELLAVTGLRIDIDYYTQYVAGQRGIASGINNVNA